MIEPSDDSHYLLSSGLHYFHSHFVEQRHKAKPAIYQGEELKTSH